ncbi:hypothetical protein M0P48_05455 [Candidatus Gracilibacteria bacterium]|jgi:hypothetical protein|nr:hypothetical protein [Candidatus Gracilibacteria bacterium]
MKTNIKTKKIQKKAKREYVITLLVDKDGKYLKTIKEEILEDGRIISAAQRNKVTGKGPETYKDTKLKIPKNRTLTLRLYRK